MGALEDCYQVDLSDADFSKAETAASIEHLIQSQPSQTHSFQYPTWPQAWPARIFRAAVFNLLAIPSMLLLGWPRVIGRRHLAEIVHPSSKANLIVANHVTFFDPAYVMIGLPEQLRRRLAVAMDGELLESMRTPPPGTNIFKSLIDRLTYFLLLSIFNVFPLPRQAGFQLSFAFMGSLIDRGWNVLIFPEGVRTKDGRLSSFRAGIGLLATRLRVPVIPVYLGNFWELKQKGKRVARPGEVYVSVGEPIVFTEADSAESIAQDLQSRVAALREGNSNQSSPQ
jgi:long-chain acyl-CoA synthetase